jgi:hypothetical protein
MTSVLYAGLSHQGSGFIAGRGGYFGEAGRIGS